jgi:hypothetical protein
MAPERPAGAAARSRESGLPVAAGRVPVAIEPKRLSRPERAGLYAALDLGTNSCRMLIARPNGAQFEVVDSFSRAVELGIGLETLGAARLRADGADGARAAHLPAQARGAFGDAHAAGGDRGVPTGAQRARVHPQDPARDRPQARDHPARGGGAAGGDLLRAAG